MEKKNSVIIDNVADPHCLLTGEVFFPFDAKGLYKPVNEKDFINRLTKALDGDESAKVYIDNCTINRRFGFDMFTHEYWGNRSSINNVTWSYTASYTAYQYYRKHVGFNTNK